MLIKLKTTKNIFNFQRKNDDWDFNTGFKYFQWDKIVYNLYFLCAKICDSYCEVYAKDKPIEKNKNVEYFVIDVYFMFDDETGDSK